MQTWSTLMIAIAIVGLVAPATADTTYYFEDFETLPLGAIGIYTAGEKVRVGLQQIMAGARKWRTDLISRDDIASLTEEATRVTGVPYIMDAYREEALEIIDGR